MSMRVLSCLLCLSVTLTAQQVALPEAWTGSMGEGGAGRSVANLGDIDGDGVDDFAWGEPRFTQDHVARGRVVVRSGADGATLAQLLGAAAGDRFGWDVAGGGDFDGDGTPDLAVGSPRHDGSHPNGGLAQVFSGATFLPLMAFEADNTEDRLGTSLAFVVDLDGDGDDELLVGAPRPEAPIIHGYARLYRGGDGGVQATFVNTAPFVSRDLLGMSVADVGDVNADGFHDLGVGAPAAGLTSGRVLVFSGRPLGQGPITHVLHDLSPGVFADTFGFALSGLGDVNDDGHDDFLVGDPTLNGSSGQVTIRSGATGGELRRFDGLNFARLGVQVAGVGDLDDDGLPDVAATGAGFQAGDVRGLARAWSSADGALLMDAPADATYINAFEGVAPGGDRDGDGRPEVLFGLLEVDLLTDSHELPGRGKLLRVEVDELLRYRGLGLHGEQGLPVLSADGTLLPGSPIALEVLGGLPSAPLFFVVGVSELIAPVEGGYLVPHPDIVLGLALDGDGALALGGTWPAGVPAGVTLAFQGWIVDASGPFGFTATNGIVALTP